MRLLVRCVEGVGHMSAGGVKDKFKSGPGKPIDFLFKNNFVCNTLPPFNLSPIAVRWRVLG